MTAANSPPLQSGSDFYKEPTVDVTHASPALASCMKNYFHAKNSHSLDTFMACFSRDLLTYTDAVLGWELRSYPDLHAMLGNVMPKWGRGKSYPLRIIGDESSAVVSLTDTPELFGGELHALGAVNFTDGKVVRWVDYWDSTTFDTRLFDSLRTPDAHFPSDFRESALAPMASAQPPTSASLLQHALASGTVEAACDLMTYDVVYEDMALRTQLLGRSAVTQYLKRALAHVPYGNGARLRHILGGALGGGFEWIGGTASAVKHGITAIEYDEIGKMSRITHLYDARSLPAGLAGTLATLSLDKVVASP